MGVVDEDQPRLLVVDADGHLLLDGLAIGFVTVVVGGGEKLGAEGGLAHPCSPQHQHPGRKNCECDSAMQLCTLLPENFPLSLQTRA